MDRTGARSIVVPGPRDALRPHGSRYGWVVRRELAAARPIAGAMPTSRYLSRTCSSHHKHYSEKRSRIANPVNRLPDGPCLFKCPSRDIGESWLGRWGTVVQLQLHLQAP